MKACILFFAVLGLAAASAIPAAKTRTTRDLKSHWDDFFALVDTDALMDTVIVYLAEDKEVQDLTNYVLSEDFAQLVSDVQQIPEYIAFLNLLEAGGLDVWTWVNVINDILGLDQLSAYHTPSTARKTGGVAGLWADLLAILPLDEARALFEEKLATSSEFADFIGIFTSPEAAAIYAALKANEEYQHIRATLVAAGLDVEQVFNVLKGLIGWN